MKTRAMSATILLLMSMSSAFPTVRIYDDRGGQIGEYLAKFQALRVSGEQVVIDGTCASACTMLLGTIPRNRICVTPRAVLEFHIRHGGLHSRMIYLRGPELAAMYPICQ